MEGENLEEEEQQVQPWIDLYERRWDRSGIYYLEHSLRWPEESNQVARFWLRDLEFSLSPPTSRISVVDLRVPAPYRLLGFETKDWLLLAEKLKFLLRFLVELHFHTIELLATKRALLDCLNPYQHLIFNPKGTLGISNEDRALFCRDKARYLRDTFISDLERSDRLVHVIANGITLFKHHRSEAIRQYYILEILRQSLESKLPIFSLRHISELIYSYLNLSPRYTSDRRPIVRGLSDSPSEAYSISTTAPSGDQALVYSDNYKTVRQRYLAYVEGKYSAEDSWEGSGDIIPYYQSQSKTLTAHCLARYVPHLRNPRFSRQEPIVDDFQDCIRNIKSHEAILSFQGSTTPFWQREAFTSDSEALHIYPEGDGLFGLNDWEKIYWDEG